jgi:hypothetical protein
MAGGCGGCPPQNLKRGELPTLATSPRVGPKTLVNPKLTGVGNWEVQGVWGASPNLPAPLLAYFSRGIIREEGLEHGRS